MFNIKNFIDELKENFWLDMSFLALAGIVALLIKVVHQNLLMPILQNIPNIL